MWLFSYGDYDNTYCNMLCRWLFWSDIGTNSSKIVRMSMDGTQSIFLIGKPYVKLPNGLFYDYVTQTLYWIDALTNIIGSIKPDGTQPKEYIDLTRHFTNPHAFSLVFFRGNIYYSDWLSNDIKVIYAPKSVNEYAGVLQSFRRDPTTIRVTDIDLQPDRPGGSKLELVSSWFCL